jgi:hypothetical protein
MYRYLENGDLDEELSFHLEVRIQHEIAKAGHPRKRDMPPCARMPRYAPYECD